MTLDGAMIGAAFPALRPNDVVILDNLPAHKPVEEPLIFENASLTG